MEKKSYVPSRTKYLQKEDGLGREKYYPQMNCKWCDKQLNDAQVYSYLLGKSKGTACSAKCSMKLIHYKNPQDEINKKSKKCKVCNKLFFRDNIKIYKYCSRECAGVISSKRMQKDNPMFCKETRKKASDTLKEINHKPIIQGGNGRGATVEQLSLYNELNKIDGSFSMEYIEKTGKYKDRFKAPNHYKIDIASNVHKIAIEVDGSSHNSLKIKECDQRKDKLLSLRGWKVLRLSNSKIQNELENCVQMVMSMI